MKCLMPFRKCTEILQGDKYPTISLVLPMLELLSQEEGNEERDIEEEFDLDRGELNLLNTDLLILKERNFITHPDEFKTVIDNFKRALKQRMTTTRPTSNQRPIQVNRQDQPQAASSSD